MDRNNVVVVKMKKKESLTEEFREAGVNVELFGFGKRKKQ